MTDTNPNELVIERMFDAPRDLVWEAWTNPEWVMKWWGPKNYTSPVAKIDLREGGKYLYAMQGQDGINLWSTGTFRKIQPKDLIVVTDSFSNENGDIVSAAEYGMGGDWPLEMEIRVTFEEDNGKTKLSLHYPLPESEAAREMIKNSGMNEGWQESFDKLAAVVEGK